MPASSPSLRTCNDLRNAYCQADVFSSTEVTSSWQHRRIGSYYHVFIYCPLKIRTKLLERRRKGAAALRRPADLPVTPEHPASASKINGDWHRGPHHQNRITPPSPSQKPFLTILALQPPLMQCVGLWYIIQVSHNPDTKNCTINMRCTQK